MSERRRTAALGVIALSLAIAYGIWFGGAAMGLALFVDSFIATPVHLYLGFGVLTALAVAAGGWIPALVHVQREYQDRLGLSIGIAFVAVVDATTSNSGSGAQFGNSGSEPNKAKPGRFGL